jgi:hypothetical protein
MAGLLDWISSRNLKQRIGQGIRVNLFPGLVLWILGACLVILYYTAEFSRPWFNEIISLKETYGFAYSAVSTCFFGGLIPYIFMQWTGRDSLTGLWSGLIFLGYWALRGIDVDAFYRLQAMIFGKGDKTWSELLDMILIFTVTTWVVWIPGTAIIYSLPYPLQIPLFNLTLCFFVILVSVFSQKENRHK